MLDSSVATFFCFWLHYVVFCCCPHHAHLHCQLSCWNRADDAAKNVWHVQHARRCGSSHPPPFYYFSNFQNFTFLFLLVQAPR